MAEQWIPVEVRGDLQKKVDIRQQPQAPAITADQRTLWLAMRQALLMVVDAIEVYLQLENRTSELRRRAK